MSQSESLNKLILTLEVFSILPILNMAGWLCINIYLISEPQCRLCWCLPCYCCTSWASRPGLVSNLGLDLGSTLLSHHHSLWTTSKSEVTAIIKQRGARIELLKMICSLIFSRYPGIGQGGEGSWRHVMICIYHQKCVELQFAGLPCSVPAVSPACHCRVCWRHSQHFIDPSRGLASFNLTPCWLESMYEREVSSRQTAWDMWAPWYDILPHILNSRKHFPWITGNTTLLK